MKKIPINPKSLKIPAKAYSQWMLISWVNEWNILFITGQLPQNKDWILLHIGDVEKQTRLVFSNISAILEEANMTLESIVKLTIYVKGSENTKIVSAVRDELFSNIRPASTLVEVVWFAREGGCIEIDAIAVK